MRNGHRKHASRVAWFKDSVRPYESFWALLHRFVLLNRPSSNNFIQDFFHKRRWPSKFYEFSPLSGVVWFLRKPPEYAFNFEKFSKTISCARIRLRDAYADFLSNSPFDHHFESGYLRFCGECLQYGYHSVAFQFKWLWHCPMHNAPLNETCPFCGLEIYPYLTRSTFSHPFCCTNCFRLLLPSKKAALSVTAIPDAESLGEIIRFYRELTSTSVYYIGNVGLYQSRTPEVGAVTFGQLFGIRLPDQLVRYANNAASQWSYRRVRYGDLYQPLNSPGKADTNIAEDKDRPRRHALLYKAYRRHLLRTHFPRQRRWHLRKCSTWDGEALNGIADHNAQAATMAFALYLWETAIQDRFLIQRAEVPDLPELSSIDQRREDLVYHGSWTRYSWRYKSFRPFSEIRSKGGVIRKRFDSEFYEGPYEHRQLMEIADGKLLCTPTEKRWLIDHCFVHDMEALFNEALTLARRMVELRKYWAEKELFSRAFRSGCILKRHPRSGRLSFWMSSEESNIAKRVDRLDEAERKYSKYNYRFRFLAPIYR